MTYRYRPKGVCSSQITFEIDEQGRLHNLQFCGGCNGNTQGLSRLAEGMDAEEACRRLRGVRCGMRPSSCPDQLSLAIEQALKS